MFEVFLVKPRAGQQTKETDKSQHGISKLGYLGNVHHEVVAKRGERGYQQAGQHHVNNHLVEDRFGERLFNFTDVSGNFLTD